MNNDLEQIWARFKRAQDRRNEWNPLLYDAYRYAVPGREKFYSQHPGQRRENEVFDQTAVQGVQDYASQIQHMVIPPWQRWSRLVPGAEVGEDDEEDIADALETITDTLFLHFWHSNLDMMAHESLQDLSVSTGALLFQEAEPGGNSLFEFTSVPLAHLYPEEGRNGVIDTNWRTMEVPVRAIQDTWKDAKLPAELEKLKGDKPESLIQLVEGTIYVGPGKWRYLVLYEKADRPVVEREMDDFPWLIFRASKTPGEVLGRGPVIRCLPDIMVLNKADEFRLRAAALEIGGIYTARNDGVLNPYNLELIPNTVIPVGSNDNSNPSLRRLENGSPNMADLFMEERRERVRKALLSDPLGPVDAPVKSATEHVLRNQEYLRRQGAQFGRLQQELAVPLVRRGIKILQDNDKISAFKVDGKEVSIQHQSPLSKMQDQADLAADMQYLEIMQGLGPEAFMMNVKVENVGEEIGEKLGTSSDMRRNKVEREQFMEDIKTRMAAMMAEQQLAAQGGQA